MVHISVLQFRKVCRLLVFSFVFNELLIGSKRNLFGALALPLLNFQLSPQEKFVVRLVPYRFQEETKLRL